MTLYWAVFGEVIYSICYNDGNYRRLTKGQNIVNSFAEPPLTVPPSVHYVISSSAVAQSRMSGSFMPMEPEAYQ